MTLVPCEQGQLFDKGSGGDKGIAFGQGGKASAEVGVLSCNGVRKRDKPTSTQFGQNGFPFGIAESGLGEQFFLGDDGIIDDEAIYIE
jgi:hypothetical protein